MIKFNLEGIHENAVLADAVADLMEDAAKLDTKEGKAEADRWYKFRVRCIPKTGLKVINGIPYSEFIIYDDEIVDVKDALNSYLNELSSMPNPPQDLKKRIDAIESIIKKISF